MMGHHARSEALFYYFRVVGSYVLELDCESVGKLANNGQLTNTGTSPNEYRLPSRDESA